MTRNEVLSSSNAQMAEEAAERYRQHEALELAKSMAPVLNQIANVGLPVSLLPEDIFVRYFLPYFAGKITDPELSGKVYRDWIRVAGTPVSEVDIFRGNNKKDILFRVPPTMNTGSIDALSDTRSMSSILYNLMIREGSPQQAAFGEAATHEKAVGTVKPNLRMDHQQRWLEIFTMYGYISSNQNTQSNISSTREENFDDDFIY